MCLHSSEIDQLIYLVKVTLESTSQPLPIKSINTILNIKTQLTWRDLQLEMVVLTYLSVNLSTIMLVINTLYLMTLGSYLTQIMKKLKDFVILQSYLKNAQIKLIKLTRWWMELIFMMPIGLAGRITRIMRWNSLKWSKKSIEFHNYLKTSKAGHLLVLIAKESINF